MTGGLGKGTGGHRRGQNSGGGTEGDRMRQKGTDRLDERIGRGRREQVVGKRQEQES